MVDTTSKKYCGQIRKAPSGRKEIDWRNHDGVDAVTGEVVHGRNG